MNPQCTLSVCDLYFSTRSPPCYSTMYGVKCFMAEGYKLTVREMLMWKKERRGWGGLSQYSWSIVVPHTTIPRDYISHNALL